MMRFLSCIFTLFILTKKYLKKSLRVRHLQSSLESTGAIFLKHFIHLISTTFEKTVLTRLIHGTIAHAGFF